jgi:dolichol kinase
MDQKIHRWFAESKQSSPQGAAFMSSVVREKDASTPTRHRVSGPAKVPASRRARRIREMTRQPAGLLETLVNRLPPHEWRRRLVHMSPGLLAVLLPVIPHTDPMGWYSVVILLVAIGGSSLFALRREALFRRQGDGARGWSTSVISYGIITLSLVLALPAQPEIAMAVTMIIAFGDGSATLAGMLFQGRKLPWNRDKSWAGLAAFLLCAIPLATLAYWVEARPGVALSLACACVAPAALMAAMAESLPVRINDNIRVGVTAGLTMLATHGMFVGW